MLDSLLQFLRSNPFIVPVIFGLFGFFYFWYGLRKEKKLLHCAADYAVLVDPDAINGLSKLKVTYEGKEIVRVYSHNIRIRNVGKKGLKGDDVKQPWTVTFEEPILDYTVKEPEAGHKFELTEPNILCIMPSLLNPSDEIVVSFLTTSRKLPLVVARALDFPPMSVGPARTGGGVLEDVVMILGFQIIFAVSGFALWKAGEATYQYFLPPKVDKESFNLLVMEQLRKIEGLVRARAAHDGLRYVAFDSSRLPSWASSQQAIATWNRNSEPIPFLFDPTSLNSIGIRFVTSETVLKTSAPNKEIPKDTIAFDIYAEEYMFPYKGISVRGDFIPARR